MATCLRCGVDLKMGTLCSAHARELGQCGDITAEQIVAAVPAAASAWLIDQWGCTHGVPNTTVIGRNQDKCGFAILHHSVSSLHAQLEVEDGRGRVRDRGSLNGTFVNGERARDTPIFEGDVLKVGDVCFYFSLVAVSQVAGDAGTGRTVPSRAKDIALSVTLADAGTGEVELVQRIAGGIARVGDQSLELARLEFSLLQQLIARKQQHADPELCFVSSSELSDNLDFKSRDADSDNVRELVRRVRRKLKAAGVADLIESRQGVGYRIGWDIKP